VRKQKGGAAHLPDDRFPIDEDNLSNETVVSVIPADADGGGPVFAGLKVTEKELIAAAERPQDPYDEQTPGDEPVG